MKYSLLFFLFCSSVLFAQTQITIHELSDFIGQQVKVCDKVYGTYITKSDPPMTLINVGGNYPDNPLTLVLFSEDLKKFSYTPAEFLADKNICVTGKLKRYKGKPEIVLNSEKDIEIIEN